MRVNDEALKRVQFIFLCLFFLAAGSRAGAEGVAYGGYFSFKGAGLTMDKTMEHGFIAITVNTDFSGVINGCELYPGYRGSAIYNQVFARGVTDCGVTASAYAGMGIFYGYLRNHDRHFGHSAGLSGDVGVMFDFPAGVRFGLGMTCDMGLSVRMGSRGIDNSLSKWYCNGVQRAWYPELRVLYKIGEPHIQSVRSKRSRVTFGVEWGIALPFVYICHRDFMVGEGYRVSDDGTYWHIHANGEILGHIGYDLSERLNLAVYAGYSGICKDFRVIPVSARATYCMAGTSGNGPLAFVDYGVGLNSGKDVNIGKLGFGYRFGVQGGTHVDFLLVGRLSGSCPDIIDPDTRLPVPTERIFRNIQTVGSVGLSMSITL